MTVIVLVGTVIIRRGCASCSDISALRIDGAYYRSKCSVQFRSEFPNNFHQTCKRGILGVKTVHKFVYTAVAKKPEIDGSH